MYKKVIDRLKTIDSFDDDLFRDMIFELAGKHPSIFNSVYDTCTTSETIPLEKFMQDYAIPLFSKIPCIKIYRGISGEGLKEAKLAVERINPSGVYGDGNGYDAPTIQSMYDKWTTLTK